MPHSTLGETSAVDELFAQVFDGQASRYGFGAMSCSVYDTAWVSAVTKTVGGVPQYLFPSSFLALLNAQSPEGSWEGHFIPERRNSMSILRGTRNRGGAGLADRILSTMAALWTMNIHAATPLQISVRRLPQPSLDVRIASAVSSLENMLALWDVDTCNSVGFEVLCPALLGLLSSQGHEFWFPSKEKLFKVREAKLARVSPKMIYKLAPSALLHSLEALHDWPIEDFDVAKIKHHMVGGSIMASPSATASYLMKAPEWDDEAEAYLRMVVECGDGMGSGAVPSAYPSTNFETLWVVSTLAEYNVWGSIRGTKKLNTLLNAIDGMRSASKGLVGFAPGIEPDLDDSAKASIVLSLGGRSGFSAALVREFDTPTHLKTYSGERDPSLSANCNALMSLLLDSSDFPGKSTTIDKVLRFLIREWSSEFGQLKDKWNLSSLYSMMLITKVLAKVLVQYQAGLLQVCPDLVEKDIVPLLEDCLYQVKNEQHQNGSWGSIGPFEETAYAVLTLVNLAGLEYFASVREEIDTALARGRDFLLTRGDASCEHLWIEKITYGSQFLMDAYVLAALHAEPDLLRSES
ncbi:hypothetical protein M011DRAFT_461105 [Sporormia fimetaria CBS 119925]|uniref:Ent-kaurene synthase n=1 Tax=Sporormia fimetaria CBS 119925 TaxID=1340428 RepID=A0A6A6V0U9_9PLEO|nr:hypothetical protein M011DRAFT_461105 [Sporormia fimetaria CBS 119925]